jgi:hypothetical protein
VAGRKRSLIGGVILDYIRYQETEQLFKAWPLLEAILESLKIDLLIARKKSRNKESLAPDEDYIESMTFGSDKSLGFVPPVGSISDKTGSIAANYSKAMQQDIRQYAAEWREFAKESGSDYLLIASVLDKIGIAFRNITKLQQDILRLYYWENKVWKEVSREVSAKSVSALKAERDRAINKMAVILKNSISYETYEKIREMVDTRKEG